MGEGGWAYYWTMHVPLTHLRSLAPTRYGQLGVEAGPARPARHPHARPLHLVLAEVQLVVVVPVGVVGVLLLLLPAMVLRKGPRHAARGGL